MTLYPFEMQIAVDANYTDTVVKSGSITIYASTDTAMATPLALVDNAGMPISNPLTTSSQGFVPRFQATLPHIMWSGGGYSGYLSSYKGLLDEAMACRLAAETASIANIPTGGTIGQVLTKASATNGHTMWGTPIVIIGPADAWPIGLPEGTLVVRRET